MPKNMSLQQAWRTTHIQHIIDPKALSSLSLLLEILQALPYFAIFQQIPVKNWPKHINSRMKKSWKFHYVIIIKACILHASTLLQ